MPAGKLSAQSGHAFTDALYECHTTHPDRYHNYRIDGLGGSKVTLQSKNERHLIDAFNAARQNGIPCSIVVDRQHILPPHFDGNPIITAVGIGPCTKSEVRSITKKFQCVKGVA